MAASSAVCKEIKRDLLSPTQLVGYVKGGGAWTSVDYVINSFGPPAFNSENAFSSSRDQLEVPASFGAFFA